MVIKQSQLKQSHGLSDFHVIPFVMLKPWELLGRREKALITKNYRHCVMLLTVIFDNLRCSPSVLWLPRLPRGERDYMETAKVLGQKEEVFLYQILLTAHDMIGPWQALTKHTEGKRLRTTTLDTCHWLIGRQSSRKQVLRFYS